MMDRSHELFVRFVDQMASGRFYEAHESMERLWALCGYVPASPYRGLTQLAVALAHLEKENFEGAQSVLAKARKILFENEADFKSAVEEVQRRIDRRVSSDAGINL
ncbi:MAG TPA: DUF309 domain-containing protein [Leptospiraceae bacterium]|nr:DUF309 domain-containing protein [Leptospiraceae bacterium]HNN75056.1 DUF309 domain-containing protein [Leptospiraceae bacterium]